MKEKPICRMCKKSHVAGWDENDDAVDAEAHLSKNRIDMYHVLRFDEGRCMW